MGRKTEEEWKGKDNNNGYTPAQENASSGCSGECNTQIVNEHAASRCAVLLNPVAGSSSCVSVRGVEIQQFIRVEFASIALHTQQFARGSTTVCCCSPTLKCIALCICSSLCIPIRCVSVFSSLPRFSTSLRNSTKSTTGKSPHTAYKLI